MATVRRGALVVAKASVVRRDVSVSACAIWSVDHSATLNSGCRRLRRAKAVEAATRVCHVQRATPELRGRIVTFSEASVVDGDVLISSSAIILVATGKLTSLKDGRWLEVLGTVHLQKVQFYFNFILFPLTFIS